LPFDLPHADDDDRVDAVDDDLAAVAADREAADPRAARLIAQRDDPLP
jgi:hypothetical protein